MSENTLAKDILLFLKKVSSEYYLPPDQREEAAKLYERAGAPVVEQVMQTEVVNVELNGETWPMPKKTYDKAVEHLQNGQVIQAIKEVRFATRAGLKEAKDLVELSPQFAPHHKQQRWY